jgi:hypothetical protein
LFSSSCNASTGKFSAPAKTALTNDVLRMSSQMGSVGLRSGPYGGVCGAELSMRRSDASALDP